MLEYAGPDVNLVVEHPGSQQPRKAVYRYMLAVETFRRSSRPKASPSDPVGRRSHRVHWYLAVVRVAGIWRSTDYYFLAVKRAGSVGRDEWG